jgi:hypothetical protein
MQYKKQRMIKRWLKNLYPSYDEIGLMLKVPCNMYDEAMIQIIK